MLVDGRNRLKACELAGVEPRFERLNGTAPEAYIVSANLNRRNLSKGQQAMALAMIYPDAKRGRYSELRGATGDFDKSRLSRARAVLRDAAPLAQQVLAGALSLDQAFTNAQQVRNAAASVEAQVARLRAQAPDLADLVTEERMTLAEATAAANQRADDQRRMDQMRQEQKATVGLAKGGQPHQRQHKATGLLANPVAPTLAEAGERPENPPLTIC